MSTIAETIQLSLAPVFMLAGIGSLLNLFAGRLARVIDRARAVERFHDDATVEGRVQHVWELRLLARRSTVINAALMLATLSAMATCLVVAMLFVAELIKLKIGRYLAALFILAMALLLSSLLAFMLEVRLSLRASRIAPHLIGRRR